MTQYISARPLNGELWHAVPKSALAHRVGSHRWLVRATSLCGVRGMDSWGGGGMVVPDEPSDFEPSERGDHTTCKKCSRIYRKERDGS